MQKYTKVTKWLQNESLITSLITCIVINLNDQSSQITFKVIAPQILYLQRKRCGGDYNYQASISFLFLVNYPFKINFVQAQTASNMPLNALLCALGIQLRLVY